MILSGHRILLLTAVLLMGQWLLVAHAYAHPLADPDNNQHETLCMLCLQGHSLEQMQLATVADYPAQSHSYGVQQPPNALATASIAQTPNIRGPPSILQI